MKWQYLVCSTYRSMQEDFGVPKNLKHSTIEIRKENLLPTLFEMTSSELDLQPIRMNGIKWSFLPFI